MGGRFTSLCRSVLFLWGLKDWLLLERDEGQSLVSESDSTHDTLKQQFNNCFWNFFEIYFSGKMYSFSFHTHIMNIGFHLQLSLKLMHCYFTCTDNYIILNGINICNLSLALDLRESISPKAIYKPRFPTVIYLYFTLLASVLRQRLILAKTCSCAI